MATRRLAVAVSGGRDSTALWHATARTAAGCTPPIDVVGLHVHHGLQPQADDWLKHLQAQARRWRARGLPVSLQWRVLQTAPAPGDSVEAWARRERYQALGEMAREAGLDLVLLAHHRQDQAETFLLQALRGAGPAGLAAMPRQARRAGLVWARPWLAQPGQAIDSYVKRFGLSHVEDPSNGRVEHARSRLRQAVWPLLEQHFEQAAASLSASATRAHEAAECLRELAAQDLVTMTGDAGTLTTTTWLRLSPARRCNVLRAWLSRWLPQGVPDSLVQRLARELPGLDAARWPAGAGELRLHAGHLSFAAAQPALPVPARLRIDLSQPGVHPVASWGGRFEVSKASGPGLLPRQLRDCELMPRRGGERFQRAPATLPRSLKKQYQAADVPAWCRDGPLVYGAGQLLFVPGLGIDARQAAPGARALQLHWIHSPVGRV